MTPIRTMQPYQQEHRVVAKQAIKDILIADSFLATLLGAVKLVLLAEVLPVDVSVIRTTASSKAVDSIIAWLKQELAQRDSSFESFVLEVDEPFNPFRFRGMGWRRALAPLQERRRRERAFSALELQIGTLTVFSEEQRVWFGASPINAFLPSLFPQARRIRIDHGLADILTHDLNNQPLSLSRALVGLEKLVLVHPYQQPKHTQRLSLLSDDVLDSKSVQIARQGLLYLASRLLSDQQRSLLSQDFALLLVPLIVETRKQIDTSHLATKFVECLAADSCPRLVVLKGHPTGARLSASGVNEELAHKLEHGLISRGNSHVRIIHVDASVPTEALLPLPLRHLAGPLSASHLSSKIWSSNARVIELDWRQESKATALEWQPNLIENSGTTPSTWFDDWRQSLSEERILRSYLEMLARSYEFQTSGMRTRMLDYPSLDWERS